MSFYMFDDLCEIRTMCERDPNAQYVSKWSEGIAIGRKNGEPDRCPLCGKPISLLKWLPPREIGLTNTRFPDRIDCWLNERLVVSERFVKCYFEEGLTGITLFEPLCVVKVSHNRRNEMPPKYYTANIPYSSIIRIDKKATLTHGVPRGQCDLCNPMGLNASNPPDKLCLDTSSWDGTSIVYVYSVGVVMSQEFHDFVSKNHLTNFPFKPVESRPV